MNNQTDEYPDLHHKMSKKIAQLTRVIFHLNTKNDEYEYNLKAIVSAYETELDNLVREANNSLLKYKETIMKMQKNEEMETQMKNLQDKIDIEKSKSITEFINYKKLMEERESKFMKDSNMKIDLYKSEVEMLRNKYDGLLKNIDKLLTNNGDMSKAHKKEMLEYVTEQNQKFNELLKQKLDIEDLLKEKQKYIDGLSREQEKLLEKNNHELRSQKTLSDKGFNDLKMGYEKRLNELEIQKGNLEARIKEMEMNEKDYKRKNMELQSELNSKLRDLEGNLQKGSNKDIEIANLMRKVNLLEEENNKIKADFSNERNKVYLLDNKNKQLEERVKLLEIDKQGLNKDLQRLKEKFERTDTEKDQESEKLRKEIEGLMKEISNLKNSKTSLMEANDIELKKKQKEIDDLRGINEILEKTIQEMKREQKKLNSEYNEVFWKIFLELL